MKPARPTAVIIWFVALAVLGLVTSAVLAEPKKASPRPAPRPARRLIEAGPTTTTANAVTPSTTSVASRPTRPTHAPTSSSTGPLFARLRTTGEFAVVVGRFDGTSKRVLEESTGQDLINEFSWSPDHHRLLIYVTQSGTGYRSPYGTGIKWLDLFDVASGRVTPLVRAGPNEELDGIRWSPDSRQVAFLVGPMRSRGVQSSSDKVEVIDVATAQPRTVATIAEQQWVYALRWSADGSKVAYSQSSGSSFAQTLWVASVGPGISTTRVASNVREWDWSPDNKQFAYATNDNPNYVDVPLHIVNSDGSGDHVILQPASKEQTEPWYLKWSLDGTRIALDLRKRTEVPYEAAVLDVATSEWTTFADRQVVNGTEGWETCWTKDEASIFLRDVTDGEIFLTRAAGGSERSLTTQGVGTLRLSPDGKTLAWVKKTGELFATDVATGRALQLDPGVQQTFLTWSPDSAYVVAKDAATGDYEVAGRDGAIKWRFHD